MKYRFNGKIKAIKWGDSRVSVLLEDTTFLTNDGDWKQWTDWELIKTGKYKKGEVWVSAFEQSAPEVFQACKMIEKGSEVEVDIFKTEKGFLNINNIRLGVPDVDVNKDLEPPEEPSSEQRPEDSPEAEADKLAEAQDGRTSTALDNVAASREVLIIRQTCIKAAGAAINGTKDVAPEVRANNIVTIAKKLEHYVLTGKQLVDY